MPVTPVVTECAWHPQYAGRRQFLIKKRLPRGITDAQIAAFIHDAMRRGAITHGMCGACKRRFQAELKARRGNPRHHHRFLPSHENLWTCDCGASFNPGSPFRRKR